MNAGQWTSWGSKLKAAFSENGAILEKFVMSIEQEIDMFTAFISDPEVGLDVDDENGSMTLCGLPVMFTEKLPTGHCLFRIRVDND